MAELIVPLGNEEEEDDEDMPSLKPSEVIVREELEQFRSQWKRELNINDDIFTEGNDLGEQEVKLAVEEQAKQLFVLGVKYEQCGNFYEAIQYYRRAVQLVPDIEFRIDYNLPRRERLESTSSVESVSAAEDDDDLEDIRILLVRFHRLKVTQRAICSPQEERNVTHISNLPLEVLNYIFKWVVSAEMDIVSLENLSMVCRGFYVCARDEELWRLICQRIWGLNMGRLKVYGCWRNMYIERPHVHFSGCYISRMTYYRNGERGLDNFYKPYHLVEYYRYIRFFPEGQLLMLTTPDNPYVVIPRLYGRNCFINGIMQGYYKLVGNQVTAVLQRSKQEYRQTSYSYYHYNKRQQQQNQNEAEQKFHVEFDIKVTGKKQSHLLWNHYSVHTIYKASGEESTTDFHLSKDKYPPMIYSRVKSYTRETEAILE